jgi:hypothetical protein
MDGFLPNGPIFVKFPVLFPVSRESRFRDRFALDWLVSQKSSQYRLVFLFSAIAGIATKFP